MAQSKLLKEIVVVAQPAFIPLRSISAGCGVLLHVMRHWFAPMNSFIERSMFSSRLLILMSIVLAVSLARTQSSHPIWVGILRDDGFLQLTANFNGTTWSPAPSLPLWDSMPRVAEDWFLWPNAESTFTKLSVGDPVQFERWDNETSWAFKTDFCPRAATSIFVPYPKIGFAFDQQTMATQFIELDTLSVDWQKLRLSVLSVFDKFETQALSEDPAKHDYLSNSVPRKLEDRRTSPTRLQHLSRTRVAIDDEHIYRFEFHRYYPSGGCATIAALHGWVISKRGKISIVNEDFAFGDCDGKFLPTNLRPFGAFAFDEHVFFIIEGSGYEGEFHIVSELVDDRIVTRLETE
jgi:hypothetical protein